MTRRHLLPLLSALWLIVVALGVLLLNGFFGDLSNAARLTTLALLLGFSALVLTSWLMAAWQQRHPAGPEPVGQGKGLTLDDLHAMDPSAFEAWVGELFHSRGYFVENVRDSGDHGVDLWVVSPFGERAVVQCKRYRGSVGEPVVRDLYGVMEHENVAQGFLVTTGSISEAAGVWAEGKPIELIDGARLARYASGQADPAEPLTGKGASKDV